MAVVFGAFLVIGMALPVLPLHVHDGLGFGTFVVGLVAGAQFAASLVSRIWSGDYADSRGAKRAVVAGLCLATGAGLLYHLSLGFVTTPIASAAILLAGRALLGGAESFVITGAMAWGFGLVSASRAGKVIAWIGTAMYAAWALGAPFGIALYARFGFFAVALATTLIPLATLLLASRLRPVAPLRRGRMPFRQVAGAIWLPGIGLAFSSIGFGAMVAFATLFFVARGWTPAWLPFTAFAIAFIAARLFLGGLPDKFGGARVALAFALIEAAGQALLWLAPSAALAVAGAAVTGFGYSLVYPGLGVEAVRRAPVEGRGLAMGAYTASLDLAIGLASPLLGLLAVQAGLHAVFLVAALFALCTAPVALRLVRARRPG